MLRFSQPHIQYDQSPLSNMKCKTEPGSRPLNWIALDLFSYSNSEWMKWNKMAIKSDYQASNEECRYATKMECTIIMVAGIHSTVLEYS